MIPNTKIQNEANLQAGIRANLTELQMPWYKWQSHSLQMIAVVVAVCWYFMPTSPGVVKWSHAAFPSILLVLLSLNQYLRDKAWRHLIEIEAPELHKKLKRKDA